jgi:hypothetical protein
MAFRGHRDSGAKNRDWHYLRLGVGNSNSWKGAGSRLLSAAKRRGDSSRGQGRSPQPTVARPSVPSPNGATEAHQNRSRPYRACSMWWPHTQGCASLALGWRMLAFQAKETTATTAKNTAGTAVLLTGGTRVLRATTAKNTGNSASPKATQSRDARGTRGRDARATEQQRRRTRPGRPCYSRARRFGCAHRRRPCYERQRRRTRPGRFGFAHRRRPCYERQAKNAAGTPSLQNNNGEEGGRDRMSGLPVCG